MHEENTAKVSLNVIVGSSEDNQPFNIDIVMSAKFRWRDTIDIAKVKELLKIIFPEALFSAPAFSPGTPSKLPQNGLLPALPGNFLPPGADATVCDALHLNLHARRFT